MGRDRAGDSLHALVIDAAERARRTQESSQTLLDDHAALHQSLQATLNTIRRRRAARDRGEAPLGGKSGSL